MNRFNFKTKTGSYPVEVHLTEALADTEIKNGENKTTIILLNAIGVTRNKYHKVIEGLAAKGFNVVSSDYPCCGENKPIIKKGIDYDCNLLVKSYVPKLIDIAKDRFPDSQIILMGHSLGAHIATLYSASYGASVIGVATGNVHFKNWSGRGRLKILAAVASIQLLIRLYGYLPGQKINFGGREPKTMMHQWCQTALTGKFKFMNVPLSPKDGKGLYLNIEGDDFAPLKSTQNLANLCAKSKVIRIKSDSFPKGNPHGIWIKQPEIVIETVYNNLDFFNNP